MSRFDEYRDRFPNARLARYSPEARQTIRPVLRGAIRSNPVHHEQTNRGEYHGNDSR